MVGQAHVCTIFLFLRLFGQPVEEKPLLLSLRGGVRCDWLDRSVSTPDQAFQMTAEPGKPGTQARQPPEAVRTDFAAYGERPAPFHQGRAPG